MFSAESLFIMIYSIDWEIKTSCPARFNIPKFLYIDSLPLADDESNIYPYNMIYHISPNDFSEFHRTQYPDCFSNIIEKSFPNYKIDSFKKATILDIEDYIENVKHLYNIN